MNKNYKSIALLSLICCFVALLFYAQVDNKQISEITFSKFMTELNAGNVKNVVMKGANIEGQLKDSINFKTYVPQENYELANKIIEKNVDLSARSEDEGMAILHFLFA